MRCEMYGKSPYFAVSYWLLSCQLQRQACTNTLAYYGICRLRIRNAFIAQAPGIKIITFHAPASKID